MSQAQETVHPEESQIQGWGNTEKRGRVWELQGQQPPGSHSTGFAFYPKGLRGFNAGECVGTSVAVLKRLD